MTDQPKMSPIEAVKAIPENVPSEKCGGWMHLAELNWLRSAASKVTRILELGSWKGRSTAALAEGLKDGQIICIDTWRGSDNERVQDIAKKDGDPIWVEFSHNHAQNLATGKVKALRMTTLQGLAHLARVDCKFDLIFIDADHRYEAVKADIAEALKILAPGGVLCGHDYGWGGNLGFVKQAVDEVGGGRPVGAGSIWALPASKRE